MRPLIAWRPLVDKADVVTTKFIALIPAVGHTALWACAVIGGVTGKEEPVSIEEEPVVAWAILRERWPKDKEDPNQDLAEREQDTVVGLVLGTDGQLDVATEDSRDMRPYLVVPDSEKSNPKILERLRKAYLDKQTADREWREADSRLFEYVKTVPDPEAFVARMAKHARTPLHAWFAILVARRDPEQAIVFAKSGREWELRQELVKRGEIAGPRGALGARC